MFAIGFLTDDHYWRWSVWWPGRFRVQRGSVEELQSQRRRECEVGDA